MPRFPSARPAAVAALVAQDEEALAALAVGREEYETLLWPELPDGQHVTFEASSPHRDGQPRRMLVHYLPRRDSQGKVLGFFVMALDVTERWRAEQALRAGDVMSSPERTREFVQYHLGGREREVFSCLFLDSQHRLLRCEDLFLGTLDGAGVFPREVAVRALRYRAAAVILAHNHPSGVAEPSAADRRITERLSAALGLLDVRVLDHIIVGRGRTFSFAEQWLVGL